MAVSYTHLDVYKRQAELVSGSLLGESMATIIIGRKVYTVNPPAIKVICRACSAFAKIRLEGDYTKLSVIGEIPVSYTHLQPYIIDNLEDKVSVAVKAVQGQVWSQKHGVMFAGNLERLDEELAEIKEEQAARKNEILKTEHKNAS